MKKPTVILADDHTLVLEGFRRLLEAQCELLPLSETDRRS